MASFFCNIVCQMRHDFGVPNMEIAPFSDDDPRKLDRDKIIEVMIKEHESVFSEVFNFSHLAAKSVFLLNGGAAIALLTFIGNGFSKYSSDSKLVALSINIVPSMILFLIGTALGAVVSGAAYLAQTGWARKLWIEQGYSNKNISREYCRASVWRYVSVCSFIFSIILFIFGSMSACISMRDALISVSKAP